jgi:SAM-dependent methyltransferase
VASRQPERKESERQFHDARFEHEVRQPAHKFYAVTKASTKAFLEAVSSRAAGKDLLELGCGPEPHALGLAANASSATGIDISAVAARLATEAADRARLDNTSFVVMDAEQLELPDDSVDLVFGEAVIHHLDLARALPEIGRVLRPGGAAVFLEPLGHNPAINLYRRRTPGYRTPDEHPLMLRDLEFADSFFEASEMRFFHFLSLAAVPIRGYKRFPTILRALDAADHVIFALPGGKRLAWYALLELERPRAG